MIEVKMDGERSLSGHAKCSINQTEEVRMRIKLIPKILLLLLLLVGCAATMPKLVALDSTIGNGVQVTIYKGPT
jgi:hypothetical protein